MVKILVIAPAWVGDMVMAQGLFRCLKRRYQNVEIHVLSPKATAPLLERMPEVTRIEISDFQHGQLRLKDRYRWAKRYRAEHYQQVIVLRPALKEALIPFFAKIPLRSGWSDEWRPILLNDLRYYRRYPQLTSRLQHYVALGLSPHTKMPSQLPLPRLESTPLQQETTLRQLGLAWPTTKVLALCPGSDFGPSKRWPVQYYAEVAEKKIKEGWTVWILGSPRDRLWIDEITWPGGSVNLAGRTNLVQAIDLLALADAAVTNDSGLMHVAAALEKPKVIAIFGSTSYKLTPPLSPKAHILSEDLACSPCFKRNCPLLHHHCMKQLLPQRVLQLL